MKQITIKPIITEKSIARAQTGWYTFAAPVASTKAQVAHCVEERYTVDVVGVRTMIMPGKERRSGRRMLRVRKSDWKKVLVRLKEGQKIDAFDVHESRLTPGTP